MPIGTKTKAEHSHGDVLKNIHHVKLYIKKNASKNIVIAYRSHNVQYQIAANALPEIPCNTSNTTYNICNNRVIAIISYHKHTQNNGIISHIAYVTNSVRTSIHL